MAKEMNVKCDFLENNLACVLPEDTMDVLLQGENETRRAHIFGRCLH